MPQYKLTYFPVNAVAEPIRWIFKYANVSFEDERIPFDKFEEYKKTLPLGQLPTLLVDGKLLTQSGSIGRYLGREFGLVTGNSFLDYQVDEVMDTVQDGRQKRLSFQKEKDEEKKAAIKKQVEEEFYPKLLSQLNSIVAGNGGPYITGNKITYGDFFLAYWVSVWAESGSDFLRDYPVLAKQTETVQALPAIKLWIEERPKSSM